MACFDCEIRSKMHESETDRLNFENARLSSILYSVVKQYGTNWNLTLENAHDDKLPEKLRVGYNLVGNDAIVTIIFGSALKRLEIQGGFEDPADEIMRQMIKEEDDENP